MKSQKTKFIALFSILLLLVVSLISFACQSPSSSSSDSNMHKVTIDTNGGTAGSTTSKDVKDGETFTLSDAELPTLTDKSIAYWSKEKDNYSTVFVLGTDKVTSDITIYPHWRTSIAAVNKVFEGYWLYRDIDIAHPAYLYKFNSINQNVVYCSTTSAVELDLEANISTLNFMKNMAANPIYATGNGQSIPNETTTFNISGDARVYTMFDSKYTTKCQYGTNAKYSLNDYVGPNDDTIIMNDFYFFETGTIIRLIVNSPDKLSLNYELASNKGTKELVRSP